MTFVGALIVPALALVSCFSHAVEPDSAAGSDTAHGAGCVCDGLTDEDVARAFRELGLEQEEEEAQAEMEVDSTR